MKAINVLFLMFCLHLGTIHSISLKSVDNFKEHGDLIHYANNLRTKHMTNIVFLQNTMSSFTSNQMPLDKKGDMDEGIKTQLKSYFKNLADNIEELNQE